MNYRAIHEGVHAAAVIRAREIREDFPWPEKALTELEGLLVPCDPKQVLAAWRRAEIEQLLDRDPEARRRRRHGGDLRGVLDDLIDLGVVQRLRDGRINVPDVYRLGFGMKRKGGVAPRET